MAEDKKDSSKEPKRGSKEGAGDRDSHFFEGKASRTGEEGVFLQPSGSHDSDPFVNPPAQPEASNPSSTAESEPKSGEGGGSAQDSPSNTNEGKTDSK